MLMTPHLRMILSSVLLCACVSDANDAPEGPELPNGMIQGHDLVGKCTFGVTASDDIEPGDPYVHVLVDRVSETYAVVMGTATVREALREPSSLQGTQPAQPARLARPGHLEWGDLDDAPVGQARNWLDIREPGDEIVTTFATIELSEVAYPRCFFR